jgi:exodeoxyribonuclease VII small subunit
VSETLESMSLEKILERLGQLVERLEKGDLPLEQSLSMFEEGVKLTREGQRRLDAAEQRIESLLAAEGTDGQPVVQALPTPGHTARGT